MATLASHTTPAPMTVAAIQRAGAQSEELLDAALDASGFWDVMRARRTSRKRRKHDLAIAIKPDLDIFARDAATGTSPALVEALIARLHAEGYKTVTVCDGRNRPDGWLNNRDALCVPDLIGYRFETSAGESYTVSWVDDDSQTVPLSSVDASDVLRVHGAWVNADVRISFAKAKTDDGWGYALNAANMLGLISPTCSAARWTADDRAFHLLRLVPPHMALIDAVVSSDGRAGSRLAHPIETDTVIASPSALLSDWIGAMKMGADPHVSPLNALALDRLGLPAAWSLEGDATPWSQWKNPSPILIESVRGRARWPELDAFVRAVLQPTDREQFAFRDVIVDQVSSTVLRQLDRITDDRVRDWAETLLAGALNMLASSRVAFTSNVTKGDVIQSEAPITIDVDALTPKDFKQTSALVAAQSRVLDGTPEDARGFRFRTIDGHIHFGASRQLPIDFDDFVNRVDVAASIRYMNDYIGGSWAVIEADKQGRALKQAERNIYLPQPNWTGVFGGEVIDVEKVEQMTYTRDRHEIRWRTVLSRNHSAESDDGSVVFARTGADQVDVRIFARQRFRLPPTLAAAHIERFPGVHRELAADAYGRFFDGTLANLRAAFEGEPYRVGKPARAPSATDDPSELRAFLSGAIAIFSRIFGWTTSGSSGSASVATASPLFVDELGFSHFAGPNAPMVVASTGHGAGVPSTQLTPFTFLSELGRAVGKDIAAFGVPLGASMRDFRAPRT